MTPRRLGFLLIVLLAGCAKNRCRERVDELKAAQVDLHRIEAANEPRTYFSLVELAKGDKVAKLAPSNKRPTFVISAKLRAGLRQLRGDHRGLGPGGDDLSGDVVRGLHEAGWLV